MNQLTHLLDRGRKTPRGRWGNPAKPCVLALSTVALFGMSAISAVRADVNVPDVVISETPAQVFTNELNAQSGATITNATSSQILSALTAAIYEVPATELSDLTNYVLSNVPVGSSGSNLNSLAPQIVATVASVTPTALDVETLEQPYDTWAAVEGDTPASLAEKNVLDVTANAASVIEQRSTGSDASKAAALGSLVAKGLVGFPDMANNFVSTFASTYNGAASLSPAEAAAIVDAIAKGVNPANSAAAASYATSQLTSNLSTANSEAFAIAALKSAPNLPAVNSSIVLAAAQTANPSDPVAYARAIIKGDSTDAGDIAGAVSQLSSVTNKTSFAVSTAASQSLTVAGGVAGAVAALNSGSASTIISSVYNTIPANTSSNGRSAFAESALQANGPVTAVYNTVAPDITQAGFLFFASSTSAGVQATPASIKTLVDLLNANPAVTGSAVTAAQLGSALVQSVTQNGNVAIKELISQTPSVNGNDAAIASFAKSVAGATGVLLIPDAAKGEVAAGAIQASSQSPTEITNVINNVESTVSSSVNGRGAFVANFVSELDNASQVNTATGAAFGNFADSTKDAIVGVALKAVPVGLNLDATVAKAAAATSTNATEQAAIALAAVMDARNQSIAAGADAIATQATSISNSVASVLSGSDYASFVAAIAKKDSADTQALTLGAFQAISDDATRLSNATNLANSLKSTLTAVSAGIAPTVSSGNLPTLATNILSGAGATSEASRAQVGQGILETNTNNTSGVVAALINYTGGGKLSNANIGLLAGSVTLADPNDAGTIASTSVANLTNGSASDQGTIAAEIVKNLPVTDGTFVNSGAAKSAVDNSLNGVNGTSNQETFLARAAQIGGANGSDYVSKETINQLGLSGSNLITFVDGAVAKAGSPGAYIAQGAAEQTGSANATFAQTLASDPSLANQPTDKAAIAAGVTGAVQDPQVSGLGTVQSIVNAVAGTITSGTTASQITSADNAKIGIASAVAHQVPLVAYAAAGTIAGTLQSTADLATLAKNVTTSALPGIPVGNRGDQLGAIASEIILAANQKFGAQPNSTYLAITEAVIGASTTNAYDIAGAAYATIASLGGDTAGFEASLIAKYSGTIRTIIVNAYNNYKNGNDRFDVGRCEQDETPEQNN